MTRSLRTIEAILTLTLDEARLALPELRHSLQQIDDMVTGVNDKFTAADRAMNATGAAITGWRDRIRERLGGLGRRRGGSQASQHGEESRGTIDFGINPRHPVLTSTVAPKSPSQNSRRPAITSRSPNPPHRR